MWVAFDHGNWCICGRRLPIEWLQHSPHFICTGVEEGSIHGDIAHIFSEYFPDIVDRGFSSGRLHLVTIISPWPDAFQTSNADRLKKDV